MLIIASQFSAGLTQVNLQDSMTMQLVDTFFLLLIFMTGYRAHPFGQRQRKLIGSAQLMQSKNTTDIHSIPNEFQSIYVQFAAEKPSNLPLKSPDDSEHSRNRRSSNRSTHHVRQSVCDSISQWVEKSTAEDMYGNTVNVVQKIDIGGIRMVQFFFETHCIRERCQCRGIDTRHYNSKCESKYIWTYAKVVDSFGTEGWSLIKLRGSCSCTITQKADDIYQSIWDDLR